MLLYYSPLASFFQEMKGDPPSAVSSADSLKEPDMQAERRSPDSEENVDGELDAEKRFIGRWKNFNYNKGDNEYDKRFWGKWRNMHYRPNQDGTNEDEKRFIGRWKNFNFNEKADNTDDEMDKRFMGRWKNLNYRMSDNDDEKRFLGRWRNRNWKTAHFKEQQEQGQRVKRYVDDNIYIPLPGYGNVNDGQKRFLGRWRDFNYRLMKSDNPKAKRFLGHWKNFNYVVSRSGVRDSFPQRNDVVQKVW